MPRRTAIRTVLWRNGRKNEANCVGRNGYDVWLFWTGGGRVKECGRAARFRETFALAEERLREVLVCTCSR